ncbi:MAG: Methylmalonyl-CoA carboxyltransferase 12S subunit [Syntrophaceae bacterium PtaU1.Bin231]|nr:MAG: Methylmalonyl-CoA carboxyltransferase 12S subunit [Syntrophaceae bacterium PtaU1.Bin231]
MRERSWESLLQELDAMEEKARVGGGLEKQEKERQKGKMTARERIFSLVDPGTFVEINMLAETQTFDFDMQRKKIVGDGVITGYGRMDGRRIFVFSQDATVFGGATGKAQGEQIAHLLRLARRTKAPMIGLYDSAGGRLQDGIENVAGYGRMFWENTRCSGVIPQISAILGTSTGGGVYSPALTDFILQVEKTSQLFITGPTVIKAVTGEDVSFEELGGTRIHTQKSGVVHFSVKREEEFAGTIRRLFTFLPSNNSEKPPLVETNDSHDREVPRLQEIVPAAHNKTYDMHEVIREIVDNGDYMEVQAAFARNMIICFARMAGRSVGVVANQPRVMAGVIDIDAADKAARFIRFCDAFNIPLVTLVDVPGYMPGTRQEYGGIIRHGAKMLYAYSDATVPMISVVLRKSYGGSIPAMCCHETGADQYFAWPTAEFAMMGSEAAVEILYRTEIGQAKDPQAVRQEKIQEYEDTFSTPYFAASKQYVDAVIRPKDTRRAIINALLMLENKESEPRPWRKHGNIPL